MRTRPAPRWLCGRRCAATLSMLVLLAGAARGSELSDDLKARRARVMERLGPDAMLILMSAPERSYSRDIEYEYRQDSNVYYLTGLTQDNTMLVLMPGNVTHREILFVKDRNPLLEHWRGRALSTDEARALTGIDTVLPASTFDAFVSTMLIRSPTTSIDAREAARFFDALEAGRARIALVLGGTRSTTTTLTAEQELARRLRDHFGGFQVIDATPVLTALRTIKTPYEQTVLVKSLAISSEAQIAGMRAAHPGAYEYEVRAAIEAVHRARGAVSWSYPSIVGSGPNATFLHYPGAERQMQAGDLLLADAAANYGYMAGDITRTYPVSGSFTPAQKDLYRIVLQAIEEGAAVAKPGASLVAIHEKTVDVIKAGLLMLGLITDATGDQYRLWYTHTASHYIGIDVHDVGDPKQPLEAGMAFTIEPGIYIRQSALDGLPRTAENDAFIQHVRPAVEKYADLGIRIEDSFLLEPGGLRSLSAAVPRTIEEIEVFMRHRGSNEQQ